MKIEIFVQNPKSKRWEIIDLFNDESININFKLKDLNDISKVFSTYSQDFTVPASRNNNKVFNYFFNTNLNRVRERGLNAKIYINDALFRVGQIVITEGRVENFKLSDYKIQFRTVIAQLKEKIGDDLIGDVIGDTLNDNYSIQWDAQSVYDKIAWSAPDENVLIPLVSNRRVWSYGDGGANDIKQPGKGITKYELRPAIKLKIILDLLIQYYDLNIDFPLKNAEAFDKLYVWLNGMSEEEEQPPITYEFKYTQPWVLDSGGIPPNEKTFFNVTTDNGGMKISDTGYDYSLGRYYSISHSLGGIINADDGTPYTGRIVTVVTERGTNNVVTHESSDVEGAAIIYYRITQERPNVERIYDISFIFDNPVEVGYVNTMIQVLHYLGTDLPSNRMRSNNNLLPVVNNDFNIKYALGEWKVIDLFTSIFKMFNIRVVEDFNDNSMIWLTPSEFYSNTEAIDINKYTDVIKYTIQPSPNYKDIVFKHTNENYFRNAEYKKLVNKDYGSEVYKSDDKALTESYQVETKFSIMNWFLLNGTSLKTSYGFSKPDSPQEPSVPTIMYNQGIGLILTDDDTGIDIRFKIPNISNPGFTEQLVRYIKFGNQSSSDFNTYQSSLTFDIDIEPSANRPMLKSLYNNYYRVDIERLYQPNSNYFNFEGYLSLNSILTFDMRNRYIIEDNVYTVEEASIDITTGKFKMKLLNVLSEFVQDDNYPVPITPIVFYANGGFYKLSGAVNTGNATTEEISHYEIQYRLQGTNTWTQGLNLTYIPFVSQTWTINPVTPAGLYDVRCRTVAPSPNPNTSDWVYVYNVLVTSRHDFIPVDAIVDIGDLNRPPCLRYPPVLTPTLPANKKIFLPVDDLSLITENMQAYEDRALTIPYKSVGDEARQMISTDYTTSFSVDISLEGKIKKINPCLRQPVKIVMSATPFESIGRLSMSSWNDSPKQVAYLDSAFNVGAKFYSDESFEESLKIIDSFNNKYAMVKFDDDKEDSDVRYIKISEGMISEAPLPLEKKELTT